MTSKLNRTETAVLKDLCYTAGKGITFKPRSQWMRVGGTLAGTPFVLLVRYDGNSRLRRLVTKGRAPVAVQIPMPF